MKKLKLKENEVVHCATLKQAKKVLKIAHELGYKWNDNTLLIDDVNFKNELYYVFRKDKSVIQTRHKEERKSVNSKEFIKRHKKTSLKKRIKALEAIVNGTNESKEESKYTLDKSITHDISNYTEDQLKELHDYLIRVDEDWNNCPFEEITENYKECDLQFDNYNWMWINKQPQIGDVVKAWDNDKSKFVYGVLEEIDNDVTPYFVSGIWFKNIEKVTEISINDFKK